MLPDYLQDAVTWDHLAAEARTAHVGFALCYQGHRAPCADMLTLVTYALLPLHPQAGFAVVGSAMAQAMFASMQTSRLMALMPDVIIASLQVSNQTMCTAPGQEKWHGCRH